MEISQFFNLIFYVIRFACLLYFFFIILPVLNQRYPNVQIGGFKQWYVKFFLLVLMVFVMLVVLFGDNGFQERQYVKWLLIFAGSGVFLYGIMFWQWAPRGITIGIASYGLGAFLNALVVILNNYKMPVLIGPDHPLAKEVTEQTHKYCFADAETKLAFLGDCIPFGGGMTSVGDILILVGLFLIVGTYVWKLRNRLG